MLPETEERQVEIVQEYINALKFHGSWFSYLFHPYKTGTGKVELLLQFGIEDTEKWKRAMARFLEILTEQGILISEFAPPAPESEEDKPKKKKEKPKSLSIHPRSCE